MLKTISTSLTSLALSVASVTALAEPQAFEGDLTVVAEFERERGSVTVTGEAAYGLFGLASVRTRIEYVSDALRRVRGRDYACYEHGDATLPVEDWYYTCEFVVSEHGQLVAPPL